MHYCDFPGCGKSFAQDQSLLRHKRQHKADWELLCSFPGCERAIQGHGFKRGDNLQEHKKNHSLVNPDASRRDWQIDHDRQRYESPTGRLIKDYTTIEHYINLMKRKGKAPTGEDDTIAREKDNGRLTPTLEYPSNLIWDDQWGHFYVDLRNVIRYKILDESRRKHTCELCKTTFANPQSKYKHKKWHEGVVYMCPGCDKSFTRNGDVKRHYEAVHGMEMSAKPLIRNRSELAQARSQTSNISNEEQTTARKRMLLGKSSSLRTGNAIWIVRT